MEKRKEYEAYMKVVTDNFIRMQSDDTDWCVDWEPEDGLRFGTSFQDEFRLMDDIEAIRKHNSAVALVYVQYNTKTYPEWLRLSRRRR